MTIKALTLSIILSLFFSFVRAQTTPASCPEAAQFYAKDSINIVTFGASTVQGINGFNFQSFLEQHFLRCYAGKSINITNEGIGGETTAQGLLRIDKAIANRTGFIFILMGANDASQIANGRLTIEQTVANMRQIIERSMRAGLVPVLGTLQNFDDRNNGVNARTNVQIRLLNTAYRNLAREYKIYLADINVVLRRDFSLYQDAIHPNARGYRLISFIIFDAINRAISDRFLAFTVTQNYPNPANDVTRIDLVLPEADKVLMRIYDLHGRVVRTVLNEYLNNGKHTLEVNVSTLQPAVYILRVTTESGVNQAVKKFIVVH
ncbi:GDSL-type esterase/lipase family protein [Pedobacter sp. SYP-B3415]|uniref:GDSL-type esterase/lipase family protein n=1 Tax=Pedobacter sp. SYP-B3415 TaxID=2496641 RepID=UPI00101BF74E|nr:GDSL-type esterase/lipase family protein [Pedobacter sp. SYP-B3415]